MPDKNNISIVRVELNRITRRNGRCLKDTLSYNRAVTSYLIHVACDHAAEIRSLSSTDETNFMEMLVHATKDNPCPEYPEFDICFNRFPSYMRRSAIHAACGHVRSHETRCDSYYGSREKEVGRGHHFKKMEPGFTYTPNTCPTLYRKQTFLLEGRSVQIKLRVKGAWVWKSFGISSRDEKSLRKAAASGRILNPKLVYAYHKYYLEFPVQHNKAVFPKQELKDQLVLGADLGLINGAVCSLCDFSGSIRKRYFSPFRQDMARIDHVIGLIRKASSLSGKGQRLSSLYTKLQGLKDNYTRQLSRWIVDRAIECGAYGIVLEHLDRMHGKGRLAARTHHWCTAKIREYIKGMALRAGIRVFIINPKGTSMYAYDGSGLLTRDRDNHSRCTFRNGKKYNCDLSASYNIAARYFIRAVKKAVSAKRWSEYAAKDPYALKRTSWTLATLRSLQGILQ